MSGHAVSRAGDIRTPGESCRHRLYRINSWRRTGRNKQVGRAGVVLMAVIVGGEWEYDCADLVCLLILFKCWQPLNDAKLPCCHIVYQKLQKL